MALPIQNHKKIVPDAYHGTDYDSAEKIVNEKEFTPSVGDDYYLGDGVYFFESSAWHAKDWGRRVAKKKGLQYFGVVKGEISLGRCFDLNDYESRKYIKRVASELVKKGVHPIAEGVVINVIAKKVGIDTIRGNYVAPEKGRILAGSRFFDYSCLMICVRNLKCISEISWNYSGVTL